MIRLKVALSVFFLLSWKVNSHLILQVAGITIAERPRGLGSVTFCMWDALGPEGSSPHLRAGSRKTSLCALLEQSGQWLEQISVWGGLCFLENVEISVTWTPSGTHVWDGMHKCRSNYMRYKAALTLSWLVSGHSCEPFQRRRSSAVKFWHDKESVSTVWSVHPETRKLLQGVSAFQNLLTKWKLSLGQLVASFCPEQETTATNARCIRQKKINK